MTPLTLAEKNSAIEKYQCAGCNMGFNTSSCNSYRIYEYGDMFRCNGHAPGTILSLGDGTEVVLPALPKGFNIVRHNLTEVEYADTSDHPVAVLRIHQSPPNYDIYNVPVWALDYEGNLFVRCFMPRVNRTILDIILGHKREDVCPQAINVGEFFDDLHP